VFQPFELEIGLEALVENTIPSPEERDISSSRGDFFLPSPLSWKMEQP
jgi:hypothetical protein